MLMRGYMRISAESLCVGCGVYLQRQIVRSSRRLVAVGGYELGAVAGVCCIDQWPSPLAEAFEGLRPPTRLLLDRVGKSR